ncbi:hypothetical protein [Comamonas koreensis]|uniref:Secreted protein n=1 Tax=Comamonas koreensis TaxID=160825 RepID=A0AAW4XSU0_9BURK|nr:hypothetical protein [Comamonas koreensis]MCD2164113.1 hypothetical protein [Comamonas koreensis]
MRGSIILAAMLVGLALHAAPSAAAASGQQAGKTQPAERSDRQRSDTGTGAGSHTSTSTSTTENSTSTSSSNTARDKQSGSNQGHTEHDSGSDKDEPRPQPFEPAAAQTPGTPQPVFVISCNASGCNDNQGNFLTRSGPQRLEGPKGIRCQLMGGNWQCSPATQP